MVNLKAQDNTPIKCGYCGEEEHWQPFVNSEEGLVSYCCINCERVIANEVIEGLKNVSIVQQIFQSSVFDHFAKEEVYSWNL